MKKAGIPLPCSDHVHIHILVYNAGWSYGKTARGIGCSSLVVNKIALRSVEAPKILCGKPKKLSSNDRKRLIEMATFSAKNHCKPF